MIPIPMSYRWDTTIDTADSDTDTVTATNDTDKEANEEASVKMKGLVVHDLVETVMATRNRSESFS